MTEAALAAQPESCEAPSSTANPPSSRPSFASLFSGSSPLENFIVQAKICSKDGFPAVNFDHSDLARAANVFRLSLVMKFPSFQRPPVETLRSIVNTKWGLKSEVKLSLLDNRHALLRFTQDSDMLKALSRDSSRIDGVLYKIFKWSPDFDPSVEGSKTQIWVQLKGLPLHLYFPSMLRQISKPIGDFLRADNSTLTLSNTQRARFCIEVDLLKPLPEKIWINYSKNSGKHQEVTYEMIPNFCKHCSIQGHMESSCWKKNPTLKKPYQKEVVPQPHQKQWKINNNQTEGTEVVRKQGNGRQTENFGKELEENVNVDQMFDEMPGTKNCRKVTQGIEVVCEEPLSTSNTFEALQGVEVQEDEEIVETSDLVEISQTLEDHQKRDVHETDIVPETPENLVNSKEDHVIVLEPSVGLEKQNEEVQFAEIVLSKTLEVEAIQREMRSHEIDIEGSNVFSTPPHGELMRQQLVFPLLGEKEDEYNVEGDLATQEDSILIPPHQTQLDREAQLINARWNIMRLEALKEGEMNFVDREEELKLAKMEVMRLEALLLPKPKSKRSVKKNHKYAESNDDTSPSF